MKISFPHIHRIITAKYLSIINSIFFLIILLSLISLNIFSYPAKTDNSQITPSRPDVLGKSTDEDPKYNFWKKVNTVYPNYFYSYAALSQLEAQKGNLDQAAKMIYEYEYENPGETLSLTFK